MPERERDPQTSKPKRKRAKKFPGALLGLGLDGNDGHQRLTKGENFLLVGGSEETHGKMQDIAVRLNEKLARRGKTLSEVSLAELRDLASGS
jgi:hypothetical protein